MKQSTAHKIVDLFDALDVELADNGYTANATELEAQLDDACRAGLRQMVIDAARKKVGKKALFE